MPVLFIPNKGDECAGQILLIPGANRARVNRPFYFYVWTQIRREPRAIRGVAAAIGHLQLRKKKMKTLTEQICQLPTYFYLHYTPPTF